MVRSTCVTRPKDLLILQAFSKRMYYCLKFYFNNFMGFLSWEIRVAFPGESQLRQIRATQPTVHAGWFSVSVINRPLTWTTRSYERTDVNACDCTLGCRDTRKRVYTESGLREKNLCCTGESNLRQRRAGPMLRQLSSNPAPSGMVTTSTPIPPFSPHTFPCGIGVHE